MRLLPVPHYPQAQATSCVPAATRMVLSFWGIERSEEELGSLLQSEEAGTGLYHIEVLHEAERGVTVWVGEMDVETLKERVDQGTPVIATVWTPFLPYWTVTTVNPLHVVVVVGYDMQGVYLNDPKFLDAPRTISWDEFLVAWVESGRFGAVIRKE